MDSTSARIRLHHLRLALIAASKILLVAVLLLFPKILLTQNLVRNGGFEEISACTENMPENGIVVTKPWYVVGDPRFVTPDLFHATCALSNQRAATSQFWGKQFLPYEGKGFMGLGSAIFVNGVFVSEGAGLTLAAPLQAGKAYYFSMQVRGKGIDNVDNPLTKDCKTMPKKFIGIYLSKDSINQKREIKNNLIVNTFSTNRMIFADSSDAINGSRNSNWYRYSNCLIAQGGEAHLGIIGPLGRFQTVSSPCNISTQQTGFFHQFYFDIDQVVLVEMPLEINGEAVICEGEPTPVHLRRLLPMPMFDQALFRWEDGSTDSVRLLEKAGNYTVDLIMPCTTIPFNLKVKSNDCATRIYTPNAFSPNGDRINDEFKPFIDSYREFSFYRLCIYDRWGNLQFTSLDPTAPWRGENALDGVYLWSLEYQELDDQQPSRKFKAGSVTLLR